MKARASERIGDEDAASIRPGSLHRYLRRLSLGVGPAVAVALFLIAAACGSSGSTTQPTATVTVTAPPATALPSTTPSTAPSTGRTTTLSVYFMRPIGGTQPDHGPFVATAHRTLPATTAPATAAMRALLAGPSGQERSIGMATAIPAGTRLLGLTIAGGTATVNLSSEFGAGSRASDAQVVYTMTQFPTVKTVAFKVGGMPLAGPAGKRSGYESVTPPIFVDSPAPFDSVTSSVTATGTANVFEATFQAKLVDAAGRTISKKTVTATSGSGTRGTFSFTLPLTGTPTAHAVRLVVWDASAENGSRLHTVSVPLRVAQ